MMNVIIRKIQQNIGITGIISVVAMLVMILAAVSVNSPVFAAPACSSTSGGVGSNQPVPQCAYDAYNALPQDVKDKVSKDDFTQTIKDCNYSTGTFSGGDDQSVGNCSSAMILCMQNAMDVSGCSGNGKDYIHAISQTCVAEGKTDGSGVCDPINQSNQAQMQPKLDEISNSIKNSCTKTAGNEASDQKACDELLDNAKRECGDKVSNWSNVKDTSAYTQCLESYVRRDAKNPEDCAGRGGIWVDQSNEGNGLKGGCQNQYSDLVNPEACAASGGSNRATGAWASNDGGKTWGCHSPDEVCNKPDQWKINDQRPCSQDNLNKVEEDKPEDAPAEGVDGTKDASVKEKCGNARTNLIACDGTGAVALNNVLKIVISVLTVLVGIAAVGGLAWASILYAKAADNQASVSEARSLIESIVIGLLVYVFLLAIVNFLVPGGLF